MKYRAIVSMILIFTMIISTTCYVFASENESNVEEENSIIDLETLDSFNESEQVDESVLKEFISSEAKNIPFTLTLINPDADWDNAKIEATKIIKENFNDSDNYKVKKGSSEIYTCDDFRIIELGNDDHLYTKQTDEFAETISSLLSEKKDENPCVGYYNMFINDDGSAIKSNRIIVPKRGNTNSEAWWERNYRYLGKYKGYKFLYSETSIDAGSGDYKKVGNISSSINWQTLAKKAFWGTVKTVIAGSNIYVNVASVVLSSVLDSYKPPISITYGKASSSYVKVKLDGDLYHMFVYIQDKRDKIPGYAYYKWGSAEMYDYQECYEAKLPVGKTASGSINYRKFNGNSEEYQQYTSCYPMRSYSAPKIKLMTNILSCYNMAGEVSYNECIKQRTFVPELKAK